MDLEAFEPRTWRGAAGLCLSHQQSYTSGFVRQSNEAIDIRGQIGMRPETEEGTSV